MTFDNKAYNREWMRRDRERKSWLRSIKNNHCPVCSMLLTSTYHFSCRYLDKEDKSTPF